MSEKIADWQAKDSQGTPSFFGAFKKVSINFGLVVVSLILCGLGAEAGLRIGGYHGGASFKIEDTMLVDDPVLNWRHRPNSEFISGDIVYHFNARGFRDYDYSLQKPQGTARIVLVSDSVGFGTNVTLEESYPKLLEQEINRRQLPVRVEILSHSMPGLSIRQKLHLVQQYAMLYQPDIVIVDYVLNDIEFESQKPLESGRQTTCMVELLLLPVPCWGKDILKESAVVFFLSQRLEQLLHRLNWEQRNRFYEKVQGDYYHRLYENVDRQKYLEKVFNELGTFQTRSGVPVVVPIFPLIYDFSNYKWDDLDQQVSRLCEKSGLQTISLLKEFKRHPYNALRVQRGDFTHPSALGNRIAAEAILEDLQRTKLLTRLGAGSAPRSRTPGEGS